jgi:hypothetical protein
LAAALAAECGSRARSRGLAGFHGDSANVAIATLRAFTRRVIGTAAPRRSSEHGLPELAWVRLGLWLWPDNSFRGDCPERRESDSHSVGPDRPGPPERRGFHHPARHALLGYYHWRGRGRWRAAMRNRTWFVAMLAAGIAGPALAAQDPTVNPDFRAPPQSMQLDLTGPFHTRSAWRLVVT